MHCTSACKARHSSKRTSDARPYGSDEEQRETNLSGASRQLPLGRGADAIHKKATIFHIVVV